MSWKSGRIVPAALLALLLTVVLGQTAQAQSLGDLSRQQRAKKPSKTTREYTNDDIPPATLSGTAPAAPAAASKEADAKSADAAKDGEKKDGKSQAELEKEYRDRAAKLKEAVAYEEKKLDVLQRELNLAQTQYYSDPNVALREQYSRDDINKRTAEIDAQKAAVEKAKQAIADLEEELRKKSLPIGWAR